MNNSGCRILSHNPDSDATQKSGGSVLARQERLLFVTYVYSISGTFVIAQ